MDMDLAIIEEKESSGQDKTGSSKHIGPISQGPSKSRNSMMDLVGGSMGESCFDNDKESSSS